MACLEMYSSSSSSSQNSASMSPRISFSNDFVESNHHNILHHHHNKPKEAHQVASSDFEFSVSNNSMMTADELFSKGRFLPFKDSQKSITTLRQELLVGDEEEEEDHDGSNDFSLRPSKVSNRWKELLGLKKSHIGSKKANKPDVAFQGSPCLVKHLDANCSQDFSGAV